MMRLANCICSIILLLCVGSSTKITSFKGVLDRIEAHDQTIILIEKINKTIIIPKSSLPAGSQINMWFNIELIDDTYKVVSIDHQLTERNKQKSTHLINKLRKKGELR